MMLMPRPAWRWGLWAGLAAEIVFTVWLSRHGDFARAGESTRFAALGLLAGLAYWLAARSFEWADLTARQAAWLLWSVAAVLRLAMLPAAPGDDFWRYLWEGKIQLHGFNPYQLHPDSPALAGLRDADWARINHRDYPAIYPPAVELIFAALASAGNGALLYKGLFVLADLGIIAILLRLLAREESPAAAAAWYAWNPLTVYLFAGGGHFDSLMVLALMGAVLMLDRCRLEKVGRRIPTPPDRPIEPQCPVGRFRGVCDTPPYLPEVHTLSESRALKWGSSLLLGLAIALKIVPAMLLPVWGFALGWRRALVQLPIALAMLPGLALIYGFPRVPIFAALKDFAYVSRLNDPLWWLVEAAVWPNPAQKNGVYQFLGALACGGLAVVFRGDWRRGMLWVLGAALLLSPVLHPWYLAWILPLAAWRGESARPWFVFSISIFGYFLLWDLNRSDGPWTQPPWLRLLILLPPLTALGWTMARRRGMLAAAP